MIKGGAATLGDDAIGANRAPPVSSLSLVLNFKLKLKKSSLKLEPQPALE